jgi:hypothetical protein
MNTQELIQHLIDSEGTISCPRKTDWESGNSACTFMKTVGNVRISWDYNYIAVGNLPAKETELVWLGDTTIYLSKEHFGHLIWWKNAQRDLKVQVIEKRQKEKLDNLCKLI